MVNAKQNWPSYADKLIAFKKEGGYSWHLHTATECNVWTVYGS